MILTRNFKETVKSRAGRDLEFRGALLSEAIEHFLADEVETGMAVLRAYIDTTLGFDRLAAELGIPSEGLIQMLGSGGKPTAVEIFSVLGKLQDLSGVHLTVEVGDGLDKSSPPLPAE